MRGLLRTIVRVLSSKPDMAWGETVSVLDERVETLFALGYRVQSGYGSPTVILSPAVGEGYIVVTDVSVTYVRGEYCVAPLSWSECQALPHVALSTLYAMAGGV